MQSCVVFFGHPVDILFAVFSQIWCPKKFKDDQNSYFEICVQIANSLSILDKLYQFSINTWQTLSILYQYLINEGSKF